MKACLIILFLLTFYLPTNADTLLTHCSKKLSVKEERLLEETDLLKNHTLLTTLCDLTYTDFEQCYWSETRRPGSVTYFNGIVFCGKRISYDDYFKLRQLFNQQGYEFFRSDSVLTPYFYQFHFHGYNMDQIYNLNKEYYMVIPTSKCIDYLERMKVECDTNSTNLKKFIINWKTRYNAEVVWFERHELLLYFKKSVKDIDLFYKEYLQLVGCTFVENISEEERKKILSSRFPIVYLNFKSH